MKAPSPQPFIENEEERVLEKLHVPEIKVIELQPEEQALPDKAFTVDHADDLLVITDEVSPSINI